MADEKKAPKWAWRVLIIMSLLVALSIPVVNVVSYVHEKMFRPAVESNVSSQPIFKYNFSKEKGSKTLTVKFYKDKWVEVTLPAGVWFRTDPDSDVQIVFLADGKSFVDGPSRRVSYGDHASLTLFNVMGLEKSGEMKIAISPKKK